MKKYRHEPWRYFCFWRGWFNGKAVLDIPPIMEAEYMEPLWFPVTVEQGFNHLLLHVVDTVPTYDHRDAWGAKTLLFVEEPAI